MKQHSLYTAHSKIKTCFASLQSEVEVLSANLASQQLAVNKWVQEASDESQKLRQSTQTNNPFSKPREETTVRLRKNELDSFEVSLQNLKADMNNLRSLVNKFGKACDGDLRDLNMGLAHQEGPQKGKPFALTHNHVCQLAMTSVGYGLGLHMCLPEIEEQHLVAMQQAHSLANQLQESALMQSQVGSQGLMASFMEDRTFGHFK